MTDEDGERYGLVVDYLNEIAKYTGWKYEYIDTDNNSVVDNFLEGKFLSLIHISCIYVGGQALTIGKFGKEFGSKDHPHTRMLSIHSHSDHFFYFRHKLLYD